MTAMVRQAGRASLRDGEQLAWAVADGRRGRRWRATVTRHEALLASLLLEVGLDGRPSRLELASPAGLLTLHPEATGGLHGNVATAGGVGHLAFAWSDAHELEVEGLPIPTAVTVRRLAGSLAAGEGRTVPVVSVALDLSVGAGTRRFARVDGTTWRIDGGPVPRTLTIDDRGIPTWVRDAWEWPLELESAP
jgi:hypothetical protein